MAYDLGLTEAYGHPDEPINDHGQIRGNKACYLGHTQSKRPGTAPQTLHAYHMLCALCGHRYMVTTRGLGRCRCPSCQRGGSKVDVPKNAKVTESTIKPVRIPFEDYARRREESRLAVAANVDQHGNQPAGFERYSRPVALGDGVEAIVAGHDRKSNGPDLFDRLDVLRDDGPGEAVIDLDQGAEAARHVYLEAVGSVSNRRSWDAVSPSTRALWREVAKAIAKAWSLPTDDLPR